MPYAYGTGQDEPNQFDGSFEEPTAKLNLPQRPQQYDTNNAYQGPSVWNKTDGVNHSNPDCNAWDNDSNVLCFNCESCKAGFLQNLKTDWKKVTIVNVIFLVFLIIVYSVGCCAFRNNMRGNWKY